MVMPCSRSACRPSVSSDRSTAPRPRFSEVRVIAVQGVGQDGLAVEQQTADQRALAVIDAAAGEKAEQAVIFNLGGHQK